MEHLLIRQERSTHGHLFPPSVLDGVGKSLFCLFIRQLGPDLRRSPGREFIGQPATGKEEKKKKKTLSCSAFYSRLTKLVRFQSWV